MSFYCEILGLKLNIKFHTVSQVRLPFCYRRGHRRTDRRTNGHRVKIFDICFKIPNAWLSVKSTLYLDICNLV